MEDDSYRFIRPQNVRQQFHTEFQANPRRKSNSCSHLLLKFLLIALFLCLIPLFPSDPPEFLRQTILAKSWEFVHLLVIGIALSYGLFCTRKTHDQNESKSVNYQSDRVNVIHHSALFDYEDENPGGNFDKNVGRNQSFDLSCFRSEPYVVLRRESGAKVEEKPLGLPVRSLRSRVLESDSEDERGSDGGTEGSGGGTYCGESSCVSRSEKGENLEGNVGGSGYFNGLKSRSVRAGFVGGGGGDGLGCGEGVIFEGSVGSSGCSNGLKSMSARVGLKGGDDSVGLVKENDEKLGGDVGRNGCLNGSESQSTRAGFVEGDGSGGLESRKEVNMEANVGSTGCSNAWISRCMRACFMGGRGSGGFESEEDDNLEGIVGRNSYLNGLKSRSMRAGFMGGNGSIGLERRENENFEGNVESNGYSNGLKSRSMSAGYMEGDGSVGSEKRDELKSQSMRAGFMGVDDSVGSKSGKDEKLEGNGGEFSNLLKSRCTREHYMVQNGRFRSNLSESQSFTSPTHKGASLGINSMFSSWLPELPNMGAQSWSEANFCMPFSNIPEQTNNYDLGANSPKLGSDANFFMQSNAAAPSMSVPASDFSLRPSMYDHGNRNWGISPNSEIGNANMENSSFLMASTAVLPCMPSAQVSHFVPSVPPYVPSAQVPPFMPSAAIPSFMPAPVNDFASSAFMPSATVPPFMAAPSNDFASSAFMPSAAAPPCVAAPVSGFAPLVTATRISESYHGSPPKKDGPRSEDIRCLREGIDQPSVRIARDEFVSPISDSSLTKNEDFLPSTPDVQPSAAALANGFSSSVKASRRTRFKRRLSVKKDEVRPEKEVNVESFVEAFNSCAAQVLEPLSVATESRQDDVETTSSINCSFRKKSEDISTPPTAVRPSMTSPTNHSTAAEATWSNEINRMPSPKEDKLRSEEGNTEGPGKKNISSAPDVVDLLSVPTLRDDVRTSIDVSSQEKNEQRSIPARWNEDYFVIPSSQNDETGSLLQDDLSFVVTNSPKGASSAGSSTRISSVDQASLRNDVEEIVRLSTSTADSDIDTLAEENDSYKPSTPSPPPQVQIRATDIASSVESSSRALGDGCLLEKDDDPRSPSTLKREKALSKPSHSRGFGCTSFFDRDLRRSFKNEAKETSSKKREDRNTGVGSKCGCLMLDVKPSMSKTALKGRSVRTIRPKEVVPETNKQSELPCSELKNAPFEPKCGKSELSIIGKTAEREVDKSEMVFIKIGISEKKSNGRKHDIQRTAGTSIILGLNPKENSNGKPTVLCDVKEEEPDSEIDKKADEFIAKFKEQIRLQKVSARADTSKRQHPQRKTLYQT